MTAIGFCSAKGSPGVTTSALALLRIWPDVHPGRRALLVEADPAGGDVAPGYLRGAVDAGRGVVGLAASRDADPLHAVADQLLALDETGDRLLLTGVADPTRAAAVSGAWPTVAAALDGLAGSTPPIDVLVDLGRMVAPHEPTALRRRLDLLVLVTRSSLRAVVATRAGAAALRDENGARAGVVVVGSGRPYGGAEVAEAVGLPLLGELPHDSAAAAVFSDGASSMRRLARSPLLRAAGALALALSDPAVVPSESTVIDLPVMGVADV